MIKTIELSIRDNDHCKRLADPLNLGSFHMEALLPFTEIAKLDRGNANVRPPSESKKPFKDMMETVQTSPEAFHQKNRGITYICDRFEFDNGARRLRISIPDIPADRYDEDGAAKFGIADGGHTFSVVQKVVGSWAEYIALEGWVEPFVRLHLMSGESSQEALEGIVEALNTSCQVQQYTMDEYKDAFDELKGALDRSGFDPDLVSFRENEDKEWHVMEIIQRMTCFLKERWAETPPASMYKSKGKALELYANEATRREFFRLFDVIREVITLPEYIQSELGKGDFADRRSLGKLRSVRPLKKDEQRPGTSYSSRYRIDNAALLPMASAFRELLVLKGDRYVWRVPPKEVFKRCGKSLYNALVTKSRQARTVSQLGSDVEYWQACAQIVMRTRIEMTDEHLSIRAA